MSILQKICDTYPFEIHEIGAIGEVTEDFKRKWLEITNDTDLIEFESNIDKEFITPLGDILTWNNKYLRHGEVYFKVNGKRPIKIT